MRRIKAFFVFWKDVFKEWSEDSASRFAAAFALYTLLALGPLVILAVSVVGLVMGEEAATSQIAKSAHDVVGAEGADAIQTVLQNAHRPGSGVTGAIIGFIILVFGVTGVIGEMQTALNTMWEVEPKPHQGIKGMLRTRLASLITLAGLLLLLLLVFIGTSAVSALTREYLQGGLATASTVVNVLMSLVVFTLLFALIFRTVPAAKVRWRDVWIGAAVTSVLFNIGRWAIGFYLAHSDTSSYFGAAGSLVVLVIFIYYSAQIFFLGAEFTQVFANRYGGRVRPDSHAQPIPEKPPDKTRN
jgi:membrane protein